MPLLHEDLLGPDAYPSLRPHAIEPRETHISWVFLTESDVFKIKKPVNLGFLDFSSVEKRKAACEAEVALNSRLAPGVYHGVVPITRDAGRHQIGGTGAVVDWAVHMRRLPDATRADELLRAGRLGTEHIDRLAARLAAFHAAARTDDSIARYGDASVISRNVEENFTQASAALGGRPAPEELEDVERFQRTFLRDEAPRLAARVAGGHVRDGHGDLRLAHVYFGADGGIAILDGIEFNERFRFSDVCADIAFLAMDLAYSGRVDLAERFVARYARESDDYDLYAVLDFYESYRAMVRAKISMMIAADATSPAEARAKANAAVRRFLLLARAAPRPPLVAPMLITVGGIIASGKSTIAEAVGSAMGAPVVDADRTRKHLVGVSVETPLHDAAFQGAYDLALTEKVYAEVCRRAGVVLSSGRPVVMDASFRSAEMRRAARAVASSHGVPFLFVECRAGHETCRERLVARAKSRGVSDGRIAIFDDFCARFEPVVELPESEHLVLDTQRPIAETLAKLDERLPPYSRSPSA